MGGVSLDKRDDKVGDRLRGGNKMVENSLVRGLRTAWARVEDNLI